MIRLFLKAKHWQLFTLILVIPCIYQFYFISQIWRLQSDPDQTFGGEAFIKVLNEKFIQFDFFLYIMIFVIFILFGWFWSIAIGLQKKIPQEVTMNVKKFKACFFLPLTYIIFLMIYMGGIFSGLFTNEFSNSRWIIAIIIPLHLFSMFCIFYAIYFVAKTIKTAELQRKVGFGDFIGEFFLLWFYFIGIWIIQPKVNKLYAK